MFSRYCVHQNVILFNFCHY